MNLPPWGQFIVERDILFFLSFFILSFKFGRGGVFLEPLKTNLLIIFFKRNLSIDIFYSLDHLGFYSAGGFFAEEIQGLKINSMGGVPLSILIPTEDEQRAQRYSYSSPSGRTKSNFFRTGTAVLHLGQ